MRLFFIGIFGLFSSLLVGQDYTILLEKDKRWTVEIANRITLPPSFEQIHYYYRGDTIHNGKEYQNYGVWLREDTLERKLYHLPSFTENECLVFDFNAQPGETFSNCDFDLTIDSIVLVTIKNGASHRAFYYSGATNANLYIEGVGTPLGLVEVSELIGPPTFELMCLRKNGEEWYGDRCDEVASQSKISKDLEGIYVFPNPPGHYFSIDGIASEALKRVSLFNNSGQQICKWIAANEQFYTLPSKMQSGLFYLKMELNDGSIVWQKVVKQ